MKKIHTVKYPNRRIRARLINGEVRRKYNEAIDRVKEAYELQDIPNVKLDFAVEIKYDLYPSFSARNFMFKYLKDYGIDNKKIVSFINKKLYNKDHYTDEELKKDEDIYNGVMKLRGMYAYGDAETKYEGILRDFHDGKVPQCIYCNRYVLGYKKHLRYCKSAENAYNENKEEFMDTYIKQFYDARDLKDQEDSNAIYFFSNWDYHTFLSNIGKYFISHSKTIKEVEDIKEQEKKEQIKHIKKESGKEFVAKFIEEFNKEYNDENKKNKNIIQNNDDKNDYDIETDKKIKEIKDNFLSKNNILVLKTPVKEEINTKDVEIPADIRLSRNLFGSTGAEFLKNNVKDPRIIKKKNVYIKFISHK